MRQIWKYIVYVTAPPQPLQMPVGARILHVDSQRPTGDAVTFWAEVDPQAERETRTFMVFPTGFDIDEGVEYVGTAMPIPELVWHLYEVAPERVREPA